MTEGTSNTVWTVERSSFYFEEVRADSVEVTHGGALRFSNGWVGQDTVLILAPGQYISVFKEDE